MVPLQSPEAILPAYRQHPTGIAFNLGRFALYPLSAILLWNGDRDRR